MAKARAAGRDSIRMNDAEVLEFLATTKTMTLATNGPQGWPHLSPLWFVAGNYGNGDGQFVVEAWTNASSQKVVNLRRDSRATLQVEDGDSYNQLRGVMIDAESTIVTERDAKLEFIARLASKYEDLRGEGGNPATPSEAALAQVDKRVVLRLREVRRVSWDHRRMTR